MTGNSEVVGVLWPLDSFAEQWTQKKKKIHVFFVKRDYWDVKLALKLVA